MLLRDPRLLCDDAATTRTPNRRRRPTLRSTSRPRAKAGKDAAAQVRLALWCEASRALGRARQASRSGDRL